MLLVTCTSSLNATWTVLFLAMMFSRSSWCMQNMTILHLNSHVAHLIVDLYYLFNLVLNFSIHNIKAEVVIFFFFFFFCLFVCLFVCLIVYIYLLLLLLLLFMTVVPWLKKTRTDIHDIDKSTSRLFCDMIKYPFSRSKYYDTFTCT